MAEQDEVEASYRVLLVDDSPLMQRLTGGYLDRAGHHVTIAKTGEAAVAAVREAEFDIVLMDVEMPNMDGLEATQEIRLFESETGQHIPVIGLTTIEADRCLAAGMDGHIKKPATPEELKEVMHRHLRVA